MPLSLAREIAYDTFAKTMSAGHKPEELLEESYGIYEKRLKRVDRNFIKNIVFGSLRWYGKLYWILQNTSKRDLDEASPEIVAALVVGTYQIYYMDRVPDRAVVNESVEYVRKKGQASACSFINGILRQIARRAEYFTKPDKREFPVEYLSLQFSHPQWIVKRWSRFFKFERLEQMLSANNQQPPITGRLNTTKLTYDKGHELQAKLLRQESTHSDKRPLRTCMHLKESPRLHSGSLFAQGFYTIQDEAAQIVGHMMAPQPGETVIDGCAGSGGKLSHIYELMEGQGTIHACEPNPRQAARGAATLARLGHHKEVHWFHEHFQEFTPPEKVDRVLLDAPCSGMGVLRRHPEGKWQKTEDAITKMAKVQRQLLDHGIKLLKVGGELTYSVCSFEPEEGTQQLERLQTRFGDCVEVVDISNRIPDFYRKFLLPTKVFATYAGNSEDMDGFTAFVVRVTKEIKSE